MLARHVSDLTGPSSGGFLTSRIRRFGMWYYCAYYSTRPAVTKLYVGLRNGWTCRVVRVLPHTKSANTACKKRS